MDDDESASTPGLVQRIEEVVRDNEQLRQQVSKLEDRVAALSLGVGHVATLVQLAAAVRRWRTDGLDESKELMFTLADRYDQERFGPQPSYSHHPSETSPSATD